jgi:ribose transport system ATP-binding protein
MNMNNTPVMLECCGIVKCFSKNKVLRNVNIKIKKGEVHALIGQNGAGKSTLVKIITGVYTLDAGQILVEGKSVKMTSPKDAEKLGIAIIHQDQQLVPNFDVTRNAFLGMELTTKTGKLDFSKMRQLVNEKLAYINADFTADQQILSLSVGQREQVAIVSALLQNPRILILDEPTASLSNKEIDRLFEIIQLLKKSGVTIIYISHHLDEIFKITDSITVLREGINQGTLETKSATHEQIVTMMIGRELKEFYPKEKADIGDTILEVSDLHRGKTVNGVSFTLHKGEILGFAGLVGAGRTETMLAVYGADKKQNGSMKIDGKDYDPKSPLDARKAGIAFIPEDRRNEGIVADMSIAQNLSLADTELWAKHGIINRKFEKEQSASIIDSLNVICTGIQQRIAELSGGNQQKVVIGRWMTGKAKIFIFDQPTTGVDVGAKTEIYKQMIKLAQKGCGIIFISSEFEELLGICDRILVMSKGKVVKEFNADSATEQDLLYWATGASENNKQPGGILL